MRYLQIILLLTLSGCSILFSQTASAQDQKRADSLITLLQQRTLNDSLLYVVYCDIAAFSTVPQQAVTYSTRAIELAKEKDLNVTIARPILLKGYALMQQGNLIAATDYFYTAAKQYEQSNISSGVATAYIYLAQAYRIQNHQEQSTRYYNKAIDIFRAKHDSVRLSSSLLNLGYQLYKNQKPDTALLLTQEAAEIFQELDNEILVGYAIGNSGLMYAALGQNELAEQQLQKAIELLKKHHDDYAISEYQTEIASIYLSRGFYQQALQHAQEGYDLAEKNNFQEMLRDAALRLSEIYSAVDNYEQAYRYQKQYLATRDSLNNEETIRKMADLQKEFEVAQKQKDIDLLQEKARNQQLMMVGLLIIVLLFILLIISLFYYNRQKQRSNMLLAKQNEELALQRHQLEVLNNTRNRFFSIISHDLRGPVNAFNGISQLIRHYIANHDLQQLSEISGYMDKSVSQLSSLLDNLLSWSVLQQGEFPYRPEKVELSKIVSEVVDMFQILAQAKNISLDVQISPPLYLRADRNSLLTILRNLFSNALKFTPAGGEVSISAVQQKAFAVIKVSDTGIGIAQDRLNSLFLLQEEKRTWGTAGEKGLGIGLRLVHDFTRMNKGEVAVESQVGVGTTFTISIPLQEVTPEVALQNKIPYP